MFGPRSPIASDIVHSSIEVQIPYRLRNLQYSKYISKHRRTITNTIQMITTEAKKISSSNDLKHGRIKSKGKKEKCGRVLYLAHSYTGLKNRAATNRTQGD